MLWSYWVFRWRYLWHIHIYIYNYIYEDNTSLKLQIWLWFLLMTHSVLFLIQIYMLSLCAHFAFLLDFFLISSILSLVDHIVHSCPQVVFSIYYRLTMIIREINLNIQICHCSEWHLSVSIWRNEHGVWDKSAKVDRGQRGEKSLNSLFLISKMFFSSVRSSSAWPAAVWL